MHQSKKHNYLATASDQPRLFGCGASLNKLSTAAVRIALVLAAATALCGSVQAQTAGSFGVTNIISDGYVPAATVDPNFIDPWGVSGTATLWINTNVTGFSYLSSLPGVLGSFKAIVPPASGTGTGSPTGTVQNTTTGFILSNAAKASFLFSTLDGTISGWNSGQSAGGNHALIAINNSSKNAVYTDLALVTNATGTFLLAPNFGQGGNVEIYNTSFQPATLAGSFTDPNIPAGYAPYAIKSIGTQVYVTYTLRTTPPFTAGAGTYQEVLGTNTGFVSVFDVNGNFVARVVTGGNLNAPWGVAIAPAGFGIYGGALLIGNFGDGLITAYNATTHAYLGVVADNTGKPIAYPGLWDLFPSTATGANVNAIYFTAGLAGETHGLFGSIANSTTSGATPTFNVSTSTQVATVGVGSSATMTVSVAPTNSFSGTASLSCSGLPVGATCSFSPATLTVTSTAPATATLTIQTSNGGPYAKPGGSAVARLNSHRGVGVLSALLLPFGAMFARRRRRLVALRIVGSLAVLAAFTGALTGCFPLQMTATPPGTSNVIVTATSGSVMQTSVVALTVQLN